MSRFFHIILAVLLLSVTAGAHAATYTLSGGTSPGDTLGNDDIVTVYVNNNPVGSAGCCNTGPITFSANQGDTLRVTVEDTGGDYSLNPLYLHSGPGYTVLDSVGVPLGCCNAGLFYDRTFTVPAPFSIPTLSEWGMIVMSSLLALTAALGLRRRQMH